MIKTNLYCFPYNSDFCDVTYMSHNRSEQVLAGANAYLKADHDDIDNISLRQILFEKKMWYFIVFSPEYHKNITFFAISQKVFVLQICYLHHHVRLFNPHSQSIKPQSCGAVSSQELIKILFLEIPRVLLKSLSKFLRYLLRFD